VRCQVLILAVGLALAACSPAPSNGPNTSASPSPGSSPSAGPTDVPGTSPEPSADASLPTQTETEWGRIWDAVPATFPRPPGSLDAEPIERTATSADLSVPAGPAETVDFYQGSLAAAGYVTSLQGPLEDGSWVFDASAGGGCKVQVTIKPLSGLTHVSILYGAGCPFG
jgi:hypothetical protein